MPRLKNTIDITYPLFIDKDQVGAPSLSIPLSYLMQGNGIYGDSGKREGFRVATEIAKKEGHSNKLLDFRVQLGSLKKQERMTADELSTVSFMNLASAAPFRIDAIETISDLVMAEVKKKFGQRASTMDSDKWLDVDPTLTSALFREFPELSLVIVRTGCTFLGGVKLPLAFFRDKKTTLSMINDDSLFIRYANNSKIKVDKNA